MRGRNPLDALTIRETAEALGVTQRYVMQLISEGKLEGSFVLGHMRFVPGSSVERARALRSNAKDHNAAANTK